MTDPTSLPDFPPSPNERPLRGRVLDVLLDEGYRPDIDDDGDVAVKVQGQQLYLRCTEGDFTVLRVFGQWRLDDVVGDELARLRACNSVSSRLSVAKTTLGDGILVVSADHLVTTATPLQMVVTSSLELVLTAVNLWHESLREITEG
ncbi:T3SS (YopN, CesT) and YbjN peptide-binding chaperone 1 [Angustibacter luteus]|uniref:TY-Chap central domain-containing protein n=1 Tax=Angustibacter luteus TaxID=658456 RepID=A0ABW1JJD0_9ACTN